MERDAARFAARTATRHIEVGGVPVDDRCNRLRAGVDTVDAAMALAGLAAANGRDGDERRNVAKRSDGNLRERYRYRQGWEAVRMTRVGEFRVASTWSAPVAPPASLPAEADVVIIGGGIVGVSTAWFLAKAGVRVVLCEKGHIAGEQSGRNWGWVRVQGRDEREVAMMLDSLDIWEQFAAETGEDVGFTRHGVYFTADDDGDLETFETWLETARRFGVESRLLSRDEVRTHIRSPLHWKGVLYTAADGRAEPHRAAPAFARAAARRGATILAGCAVRGIETEAGAVSAVVTEHGVIRAQTVLCAAGAWTSMFCRSLGIDVPQLRVKGTVARTAPCDNVLDGNVFDRRLGIRRREDGGYTVAHGSVLEHPVTPASFRYFFKFLPALRQEIGSVRLSFGRDFIDEWRNPRQWPLDRESPFERVRVLDPEPSPRVLDGIRRNLVEMFPALAGVPLVEAWAGMIESSPDVVPIIGPAASLRGFHIATGFSGHGFGIGPGAGRAIAAMLTGAKSDIDLAPFRLSRFFDGSPIRPQTTI